MSTQPRQDLPPARPAGSPGVLPDRVAYVVGDYPAPSHSFVQREIVGLRERGVDVTTFAIHRAPEGDLLTELDHEEFARTHAVLPTSVGAVARALRAALTLRRRGLLDALRLAQRDVSGGWRRRLWGAFYVAEALLVWDRLRGTRTRHLHAHHGSQAADVAMLVCALASRPDDPWTWSLTMHGPNEFYDVAHFRLARKLHEADGVVCISHFCRSQLMTVAAPADWQKFRLVRCGVDTARFSPAASREAAPDGLRILSVGRLVPLKGHALLVRAIAMLRTRGIDAYATVVGDGPERARLEELARDLDVADRVAFAGAVGQDRILQHYRDAEVFCLPSFAEGVPVVLMEAMACELAVVTTRTMGIPELVEDGVGGLLVAPSDPDALADALERLAADPSLRRSLGAAGRARVQQAFELTRTIDDLGAALAEASAR